MAAPTTVYDKDNITGGPADLQFDDVSISHTQGGITVTVSPETRERVVDQYGSTPVDVILTGEKVSIVAPLAEWSAEVLSQVYGAGVDAAVESSSGAAESGYIGIGRSTGLILVSSDVKVIPLEATESDKSAQFFRCVPVGEISLVFGNDDDRIFNCELTALVDPSKVTNGERVGKIFLTAA